MMELGPIGIVFSSHRLGGVAAPFHRGLSHCQVRPCGDGVGTSHPTRGLQAEPLTSARHAQAHDFRRKNRQRHAARRSALACRSAVAETTPNRACRRFDSKQACPQPRHHSHHEQQARFQRVAALGAVAVAVGIFALRSRLATEPTPIPQPPSVTAPESASVSHAADRAASDREEIAQLRAHNPRRTDKPLTPRKSRFPGDC